MKAFEPWKDYEVDMLLNTYCARSSCSLLSKRHKNSKGHVTRGNFSCHLSRNIRQAARKISRVTLPATATKCCIAGCKKSRNILFYNFMLRDKLLRVRTCPRNLPRYFVKIRQSKPVFCSQEISSWQRKSTSCKQFPAGALQVAKKYCGRVTPSLQLAMSSSSVVIVAGKVARKIASCSMALKGFIYCRLRYGLKRMRTSLCSFISLALSVPVSKKTTCKQSYPIFDSLRTVPFFIRSLTKLARINGQILL